MYNLMVMVGSKLVGKSVILNDFEYLIKSSSPNSSKLELIESIGSATQVLLKKDTTVELDGARPPHISLIMSLRDLKFDALRQKII